MIFDNRTMSTTKRNIIVVPLQKKLEALERTSKGDFLEYSV